jgi:hypothetical protein
MEPDVPIAESSLQKAHAGKAHALALDDEQFDETEEVTDAELDEVRTELLAKLAILEAKYDAMFSEIDARFGAIDARLSNVEARLGRLEAKFSWAFGLMFALHLVEIGILAKLGFS